VKVKIPKVTLIAASVFIILTILMYTLPDYMIYSIRQNQAASPGVPTYKFEEAISLWRIYKVTMFQPAFYVMLIVTIVLVAVLSFQIVQKNFTITSKKEQTKT
jgi:membrane-associated phospholipid phosphatase